VKPTELNRRNLVAGLAGLGTLGGCSEYASSKRTELVSVTRVESYTGALHDVIRELLKQHNLDVKGLNVVLKPNLVEFESGVPINTNPLVVHAALEAFQSLGAASVRIAEGPGHRRDTWALAEAAGYFDTFSDFEKRFTDLNLDEVTETRLVHPVSKLTTVYLPNTVRRCDLLVSMPKMKTHHWAGATLSMKNLFGIVPGGLYGWPKNILHWAGIDGSIVDLFRTFPRTFAIVDGIEAMEGNGPIQGTARHMGVIVSGRDLAAVDTTSCSLMGLNSERVEYLRLCGVGRRVQIRQIGENPVELIQHFEVPPGLSHLRATST
jgi:uncharacterized protein (DUF362 family)